MSNLLDNLSYVNKFAYDTHKAYGQYASQWEKVRDVIAGSDTIKGKGERYLPRLKSQAQVDYDAYKFRALFVNTTSRVLNTNVGTIIRRTPTLNFGSDMAGYFKNDNVSFLSFREMWKFLTRENLSVGRVACIAEIDNINDKVIPLRIPTESIINWVEDEYGNLTSVLLAQEEEEVDPKTFERSTTMVYNILYIDKDGYYSIDKHDKDKKFISTKVPSYKGNTLSYIPLVCLNPFGVDINPLKSPLNDVADINLSHYNTSADLETGRHFVGLPQPIVTGATSENDLYVGSSKAWVLQNDKAKAYYLEFLGQGLDGLAKALKEKEGQMSQFSAQLVDTSTRGSEAEGTVRLRFSSDAANLSDIAESVEDGLNLIYGIIAEWQGYEKPSIELNKDFLSDKMTHNELVAMTKTWLDGGLSNDEYRYNLKRGEILPPK